jgi:hypothetical protein
MKRIVSSLAVSLLCGWCGAQSFGADVPGMQVAMVPGGLAARVAAPQPPGMRRPVPAPSELERQIQATADFEAVVDAERTREPGVPEPKPAAAPIGPRRVRVSGLLTDSRRNPLKGVYLIFFRFQDAGQGKGDVARNSMYVPVVDGVFKASLELPVTDSAFRVIAEAPKGTGWIVKPRPYFVQAGSFEDPARAASLRAGLSIKFSEAFITRDTVEGTEMHQVRVGPFERKDEAEAAAAWLESAGAESLVLRDAPAQ